MSLLSKNYAVASPKVWVKFDDESSAMLDPVFLGRYAYLCMVKGKVGRPNSGYRSDEKQEQIGDDILARNKGYYRGKDGGIYNSKNQRMVAPPGASKHGKGLAIDDNDPWFTKLSNAELATYGLWRSTPYELWHFEPIETKGKTKEQVQALFYGYMEDLPMDVRKFQLIMGLTPDGIAGPKTQAAMKEVKELIDKTIKPNK